MALATLGTSFTFTSCDVEDGSDNFQLSMSGYVLQESNGERSTFTPYYYFTSDVYAIADIQVTAAEEKNQVVFTGLENYNNYCFHTSGHTHFNSVTDLNGEYEVNAVAWAGYTFKKNFSLQYSEKQVLAPLEVEDFTFDGSKITAKVKKLENVYNLGFVITGYAKDSIPDRTESAFYKKLTSPVFESGEETITLSLSSTFTADFVEAKVYAATTEGIHRESDAKTIAFGGSCFEEDKK